MFKLFIFQKNPSGEVDSETLQKLTKKFTHQSSAIYGATQILNDGIILPTETRKVGCLYNMGYLCILLSHVAANNGKQVQSEQA